MRAMVLHEQGQPLQARDLAEPTAGPGRVQLAVTACGVCRTDLHVVDGDLKRPKLPLVPGHQVVGRVTAVGEGVNLAVGTRVGVPWLGWTCEHCAPCLRGQENLCEAARFTGYDLDGGFAELAVADARYCFELPPDLSDIEAAPLLCAGLIGYRALMLADESLGDTHRERSPAGEAGRVQHEQPLRPRPQRLGLFGFGSAAHILCQVAAWQGREVYAFTRLGDVAGQAFARGLGAAWAGSSDECPAPLDAALLFAPVGGLVPVALKAVRAGGAVVCAGIHMSQIPAFDYELLWGERTLRSVANLTRRDGEQFLALAPRVPVRTAVHRYDLLDANTALDDLRHGRFEGAAVLVP